MRKLKTSELKRISVSEFRESVKIPVIIVLDNIRSQNNIGSVFRTADAFRCEAIYLCGITATPPHREIHKSALGATESVAWTYFPSTVEAIDLLRADNYKVYAIEQTDHSIPLASFTFETGSKLAFILGNEVTGIDETLLEMVEGCLEIPQYGTKHSLNVSVVAGIVIWDIFLKTGLFF